MERIKQALLRAREDQRGSGAFTLTEVRQPLAVAPVDDLEFDYTQTKVVELDHKLLAKNRILIDKKHDRANTAYKLLRTQIEQRMLAKEWSTLAITSSSPGQGKSVTSINLAISLARSAHNSVLLVDLDLRRPTIHKYFGYEPEKGVSDCLTDDVPLGEVLFNPGIERLVIAPGRDSIYNSSELLASPKIGTFVDEIKSRYKSRYVIFDLPPVLATDDAKAFSPYVDAMLLVIEDEETTKEQLKQTIEMLDGVNIIGTVLNKSTSNSGNYYYYYN